MKGVRLKALFLLTLVSTLKIVNTARCRDRLMTYQSKEEFWMTSCFMCHSFLFQNENMLKIVVLASYHAAATTPTISSIISPKTTNYSTKSRKLTMENLNTELKIYNKKIVSTKKIVLNDLKNNKEPAKRKNIIKSKSFTLKRQIKSPNSLSLFQSSNVSTAKSPALSNVNYTVEATTNKMRSENIFVSKLNTNEKMEKISTTKTAIILSSETISAQSMALVYYSESNKSTLNKYKKVRNKISSRNIEVGGENEAIKANADNTKEIDKPTNDGKINNVDETNFVNSEVNYNINKNELIGNDSQSGSESVINNSDIASVEIENIENITKTNKTTKSYLEKVSDSFRFLYRNMHILIDEVDDKDDTNDNSREHFQFKATNIGNIAKNKKNKTIENITQKSTILKNKNQSAENTRQFSHNKDTDVDIINKQKYFLQLLCKLLLMSTDHCLRWNMCCHDAQQCCQNMLQSDDVNEDDETQDADDAIFNDNKEKDGDKDDDEDYDTEEDSDSDNSDLDESDVERNKDKNKEFRSNDSDAKSKNVDFVLTNKDSYRRFVNKGFNLPANKKRLVLKNKSKKYTYKKMDKKAVNYEINSHNIETFYTKKGNRIKNNITCDATWDGFTCWGGEREGVMAEKSCPLFIGKISPTRKARKECVSSGWKKRGLKEWTDYTQCFNTQNDVLKTNVCLAVNCLSVLSLLPALVIFLSFRELRRQTRIRVHLHLFTSLLFFSIFNVAWYCLLHNDIIHTSSYTLTTVYKNPLWCRLLALCKTHTTSTSYAWTLCEAVYLHRLLSRSFATNHSTLLLIILGWILPCVPTIVYYTLRSYLLNNNCWSEHMGLYEWLIYAPNLTCLLMNTLLLGDILRILVFQMHSHPREPSSFRRGVKAAAMLVPLFGLQLLLTIYRPTSSQQHHHIDIYQIVSSVVTNSQGIFVSLVYCYLNGEVISNLRRCGLARSTVSTWMSTADERKKSDLPSLRSLEPNIQAEAIKMSEIKK